VSGRDSPGVPARRMPAWKRQTSPGSTAPRRTHDAVGCLAGQLLVAKLTAAIEAFHGCMNTTIANADLFLTKAYPTNRGIVYTGPARYSLSKADRTLATFLPPRSPPRRPQALSGAIPTQPKRSRTRLVVVLARPAGARHRQTTIVRVPIHSAAEWKASGRKQSAS
jgi:hypothetical protein